MIVASVRFFEKKMSGDHGRTNPPQTGYRPSVVIDGIHTSCLIESLDNELEFPFQTEHCVSLKLMFPDQHRDAFKLGQTVEFYEGHNLVGVGNIMSK